MDRALAKSATRLVVFAGTRDEFLAEDERALLKAAARNARGRWIERDLDHLQLVHAGYEVVDEELGEFARKFPALPFAYRYPPSCVLPSFEEVPVIHVGEFAAAKRDNAEISSKD